MFLSLSRAGSKQAQLAAESELRRVLCGAKKGIECVGLDVNDPPSLQVYLPLANTSFIDQVFVRGSRPRWAISLRQVSN